MPDVRRERSLIRLEPIRSPSAGRLVWLLAPALFPVAALASFLSVNAAQLSPADILSPLAWSVAGTLAATLALFAVVRAVPRTVALASLCAACYFNLGYALGLLEGVTLAIGAVRIGSAAIVLVLVAVAIAFFARWVFRNGEAALLAARTLIVIGVSLAATSVGAAAFTELRAGSQPVMDEGPGGSTETESAATALVTTPVRTERQAGERSRDAREPDIFFIVLDAYASEESILEFSGFDNSAFTKFLENRGFYVARDSKSNYSTTFLSLAATTNLRYLDDDLRGMGGTNRDRFYRLVKNNRLARELKANGYRYVHIQSGWGSTNFAPLADEMLKVRGTETDAALRRTTIARPWADESMSKVKYRAVRKAFQHLESVKTSSAQPKFVFAHIIAPHGPYVFEANGKLATGASTDMANWRTEQIDDYIAQLQAINRLTQRFVTHRLKHTDRPLVIIIQGDHGTSFPTASRAVQWSRRHSILNAVYFSEGAPEQLYPTMSPVNTIRIVLNEAIDTDYRQLKDRALHSRSYSDPFEITDVTRAIADAEAAR